MLWPGDGTTRAQSFTMNSYTRSDGNSTWRHGILASGRIFGLWLSFALAVWRCTGATQASDVPSKFEAEIQAFEKQDRLKSPPKHAIFFLGSSSFRMWSGLSNDFAGVPVVNRGFGGSQMSDCVEVVDRIVTPYLPRQIFLYEGDNDLASGKSPTQVLLDFQELVKRTRAKLPKTPIIFVSIKPSPSRWQLAEKIREANALIRGETEKGDRLGYIDVFTPMLDSSGKPRAELFRSDQLHLNADGYALWRSIIKPFLK